MQQEFEAGTADGFASFPQQNGMGTCYNLLFVSPLTLPTTHAQPPCQPAHRDCVTYVCIQPAKLACCAMPHLGFPCCSNTLLTAFCVSLQGTIASGGSGGLYASVKSTCPAMSKVRL